jgi:ribonuclease HII
MNLNYEHNLITQGFRYIAGTDEVGRGPLAGPVVAACVIFPPDFELSQEFHWLTDSKKLTAKRRELLFPLIKREALSCEIALVSPATIDKINILQASLLAMARSIAKLSTQPDYILVDGKFIIPQIQITQEAIIGGDNLIASIAAASIIAKVSRDYLMQGYHEQYPVYGFNQHMGYGTKAHIEAIKQHGPCPIHRLSFEPLKSLFK